jgi:hypothetical protein
MGVIQGYCDSKEETDTKGKGDNTVAKEKIQKDKQRSIKTYA